MNETILIIEDNKDILENTSAILKLANYNVLVAENGRIGIELARANKPDLVLCDIIMPELDGYGVLRAFENIPEMSVTPFIFISAKAEKSDFRAGMDMGADDYLVKPFSGDDLLRTVNGRLKKCRLMKKSFQNNFNGFNTFLNTAELQKGVTALSEQRNIKKLRKKDMLFMEGDSPNYLHLVVSGKVKVFKSNELGKEYIIDIYKESDFLGYAALLEDTKYNESAMAIENSEIALIPKQDFFQLMYFNSEVAMKFVKMISKNLSDAEDKLLKLAYDSARKRVAEAIVFVSKKYKKGNNDEVSFTLLRENISALSGISPESVSRNLTDFKEEGLIETSNGNIRVLNLSKLKTLRN